MFRHTARLASVAVGLTAGGLLLAAPAQADVIPVGLPPLVCPIVYTNVIVGTDGVDALLGTPANDLIIALGGDDYVYGGGGRDTILGGEGNDVIGGGPGDDCILGGPGDDESILWLYTVQNGNDESSSVQFRYQY
jgi:Ca2+-binding RTX toxin-like protein